MQGKTAIFLAFFICFTLSAARLPISAQTAVTDNGELRVETVPPGAQVILNGDIRGTSPVTLSGIPPGTHLLSARLTEYKTTRQTVELSAGDRRTVNLQLEPIQGLLLVQSEPAGAEVLVNGASRGTTPNLITDLTVGDYRFTFRSTGYQDRVIDVSVRDRTPQRIHTTLVPDTGTLQLSSDPIGARIILNGMDRGFTPAVIDRIQSGENTLQLQMDGYQPYQQELRITAGEQETLNAVLTPIPASLQIVTIPAGARIYINNQYRGESPITLNDVSPGEYRLRAEMEGYDLMARNVTLQAAANQTEEFRLEINSGNLQVTTEPAGVSVFVDGRERGTTTAKDQETDMISEPLTIPLITPGEREVRLSRSGYFTETLQVNIEKDQTASIHQALRRRFIPDYEIRTSKDVFRGVLLERDADGNVRLETRPGIIRTIPRGDIRSVAPLRIDEE